jgi:hypothetical protein
VTASALNVTQAQTAHSKTNAATSTAQITVLVTQIQVNVNAENVTQDLNAN